MKHEEEGGWLLVMRRQLTACRRTCRERYPVNPVSAGSCSRNLVEKLSHLVIYIISKIILQKISFLLIPMRIAFVHQADIFMIPLPSRVAVTVVLSIQSSDVDLSYNSCAG